MSWWPEHQPRRPGKGANRGRAPFGKTWWGAAWVDALEHRAKLDPNRLPRGRTYARTGAVEALDIGPGEVRAPVQGSRREPYSVRVRVRTFEDREWDRVFDALAAEIGHTAALLDGEIVPEVAEDVRRTGLDLLPGPGELQPRCTCPDWADPCKHAAAVCYLVADSLDDDPFVLLMLRGRSREEVLAALRSRRASAAPAASAGDAPAEEDQGVLAREAWAREPRALPVPPLPPRRAGRPTVLGADPPRGLGVDAGRLRDLAADAARRALDLAMGAELSGLELTEEEDLARRAAERLGSGSGGAPAGGGSKDMLRRALAWRYGARAGLAALTGRWSPDAAALASGKALLGDGALARHNRVTLGERQLRLGPDGCWYPYRKGAGGGWDPDGPPVAAAGAAQESDAALPEDE